jgi:uncharacterized protein YqeY
MSDTAARIPEDIKTAMKAKDSTALNALRALKSALTNASIEKGGLGTQLEESEVLAVVRKQLKQRLDSCEQFENAGRPELAATEKVDMGKVMKRAQELAEGRADGKLLSAAVMKRLA